jgi:hypothetical protein
MIRRTADPISPTELEGAFPRMEDGLVRPAHDLQEQRSGDRSTIDSWLRHGVFEGAPKSLAEPAPRVRRDAPSRKGAAQRPAPPAAAISLEEQIRTLAYELFEQRGREHGHDVEDWIQAEEIIVKETAKLVISAVLENLPRD